jgi:hypothetical protein
MIQKKLKNWEDCMSFIEFAYDRSVHSTTDYSSFEIVYGFNPLTLWICFLYLLMKRVNLDGNRKKHRQ